MSPSRIGARRIPSTRRSAKWLGSSGLVQLGVDRAGRLGGNAGNALELLLRRRQEALGGAEVVEDRAPPRRPDTFEVVEDRAERARVAAPPVEADREPVRLVAHP